MSDEPSVADHAYNGLAEVSVSLDDIAGALRNHAEVNNFTKEALNSIAGAIETAFDKPENNEYGLVDALYEIAKQIGRVADGVAGFTDLRQDELTGSVPGMVKK
jgi:hypothetical protein